MSYYRQLHKAHGIEPWGGGKVLDWTKPQEIRLEDKSIQGSEAWLKWRGKGLGSSDAAVLLGWSPWKTIEQLWNEKLGRWTQEFGAAQTAAMNRGKELEPVIRKWCEEHLGHSFPDDVAEDPVRKYMRASFDGINRTYKNADGSVGRILEIKAPNLKDHEGAKLGIVPEKYLPQCQWLMLVGKMPWLYYVSRGTDNTYAVVPMKADPIIQEALVLRAMEFWSHVEKKTKPDFTKWVYPLQKAIDLSNVGADAEMDAQTTEALVAEALKLQGELASLEAKFDLIKDKLKAKLGTQDKMQCGEAVFGWQTRKGAVDYSAIEVLKTVNLEEFRKKEVKAFYFKRAK